MVPPYGKVVKSISSKEKKYSLLFCAMFFAPIIAGFLSEILFLLDYPSITTISYILLFSISLYVYFVAIIQNYYKTFGFVVLVIVHILLQIILYPSVIGNLLNFTGDLSSLALSNFFILLFLELSIFWISLCLDKNCMVFIQQYCERFSYCVVILYFITMILQFGASSPSNYMTIAYNVMPSLLIMLHCGFVKREKKAIMLFFIGAILIFLGGCRGAFLQMCVATLLFFFISRKTMTTKKKILLFLASFIVCVVLFFYFDSILFYFSKLLGSSGFSSRTVRMLMGSSGEGDIFHIDDRQLVYEMTLQAFSFFGNGIFVYPEGSLYPHNIFLEFLLGYGYFFGLILFLGLLIMIIKSYRSAHQSGGLFELIIWVSSFTTIFVKLMLSASYLTDRPFWFYFSFMFYLIRINRGRMHD